MSLLNVCEDYNILKALSIIINIINIVKIFVPLLLIITGMISYFKATYTGNEEELKKATLALLKKGISGVLIFMLPIIINLVLSVVNDASNNKLEISNCINNANDKEFMANLLEDIEKSKEEKNTVNNNSEIIRKSNHDNVKQVSSLKYINQGWYKNLTFCQSYSIAAAGCGPVSFAMIARGYSDTYSSYTSYDIVKESRNWFCNMRGWNTDGNFHSSLAYDEKTLEHFGLKAKVLFRYSYDGLWSNTLQTNESNAIFNAVKNEGKSVMLAIPGHWCTIGPNDSCKSNEVYMYDPSDSNLTTCYTMEKLYKVTYDHKKQCNKKGGMCGWAVAIAFWNA